MAPLIALGRILELALLLMAAAGAGAVILRVSRLHTVASSISGARPMLALTLGLGALSYSVLAIGLLGGLYGWVLWTWIAVLSVMSYGVGKDVFWREGAQLVRRGLAGLRSMPRAFLVLLAAIALMALLNLVGALAPPLGVDDLTYHFVGPQRYLESNGITFVPDKFYTNLPFTMEMVWTLAIGIDSGELAQAVNWSIGLLILCWVALIGRKVGLGLRGVVLAATLTYTISTVSHMSTRGDVEMGAALFILGAVFCLLQWQRDPAMRWLVLAAVLAGFYAGTKLPNAAAVILLSGWIFVVAWWPLKRFRTSFVSMFVFGIVAGGVVGIWYVKNWLMTENPVYPFLQSFLGGPTMRPELLAAGSPTLGERFYHNILSIENPVWRTILQFYRLVMVPETVRGHVSPFFVASLPLVAAIAFRTRSQMRSILVIALLLFLWWAPTTFFIRTGLPVMALMSIPVAAAVMLVGKQEHLVRLTLTALVGMFLVGSIVGVVRNVAPAMPVVAGTQSTDQYLLSRGPEKAGFDTYDAYMFIDRKLPKDAYLLLWDARGYYMKRPYISALEYIQSMADPDRIYDPERVLDELRRFGLTHVAMTDNSLRLQLRQTLEATGQLDCPYEGKTMVVCALPADK